MKPEIENTGKLLFELSLLGNACANLDELMARVFAILGGHPELGLQARGAILLLNPLGEPVQVAQFGMAPTCSSDCNWASFRHLERPEGQGAFLLDCDCSSGKAQCRRCRVCVLCLQDESRHLGYAVFFPDGEPGHAETLLAAMADLARALSGLVGRTLLDQIVKLREWELEEARTDAIHRLGSAAEYRDNDTGWHVMRMTNYALAISRQLDLTESERELLVITAPMHDVGKIGIPDAILLKPGRLTDEEMAIMRQHTEIGETLLEGTDALITAAREIAATHHERWDGSGYPRGLMGNDIPIMARICAVADVFDALTSHRPYKNAWPVDEAVSWIRAQSGSQFDPQVVQAFFAAMPDVLRIRELYRDDIIDPREVLSLPHASPKPEGWVTWDASLSVGIDVIDEHHKYLFDLVNDLYRVVAEKKGAREVARVLKALHLYTQVHFRAEENMMRKYGYVGLERQEHQHFRFEQKLRDFNEELQANPLTAQYDVLEFARNWLVTHILEEDSQLASLAAPQDSD